MSVEKHASGRRSIRVEVEVPGTPEEVWQAIATGPGVSSRIVKASDVAWPHDWFLRPRYTHAGDS